MANIGYCSTQISEDVFKRLLQVFIDSNPDALIIDGRDYSVPGSIAPAIRESTKTTPTFLITGQRDVYDPRQKIARQNELKLIEAGARSLEACMTDPQELIPSISAIFDRKDLDLDNKIQEVVDRYNQPAIHPEEYEAFFNFLLDGGSVELGRFIYREYDKWKEVKNHENYKPLSDACTASFIGIGPALVKEMAKRNLTDYHSMGPSPEVDKKILEEFVKNKRRVRYHAVDINPRALFDNEQTISHHLDSIDSNWREYVDLIKVEKEFSKVETSKPCCVAYPGGQIGNNNSILSHAAKLCKKGGLVVADVHTYEEGANDVALWKYAYDIEENKKMFKRAIEYLVPQLKKQDGWHIGIKYIKNEDGPNRISAQLIFDKEVTAYWTRDKLVLKPNITRELLTSKKYCTSEELKKEAAPLGYSFVGGNAVPINLPISSDGSALTAILEYTGKPTTQSKEKTKETRELMPV